ncbi:MAG: 16S rRNA (uracil(1498)-N(3))-methyltransferase [Acutalibacteraceae bacterium]|nr:16S rRNA (uracil(1498)-N(3))-methyltransferase [Acutalibacteraceae bacterium]
MFNFFVDESKVVNNGYIIDGNDYNHIVNVLRMKINDEILVSVCGKSDLCKISSISGNDIFAEIIEENHNCAELPVNIVLFQGLPKSDKMELIIQKTVELGVSKIYPVEMKNCVVRLDEKKKVSKVTRWQAIAESAAKQSKRNVIPQVCEVISYKNMLQIAKDLDLFLVPYENFNGMASLTEALDLIKKGTSVGILIGPEGGFDLKEIEAVINSGGKTVSLGKRILRTETAAIVSASALMLYIESKLGGE